MVIRTMPEFLCLLILASLFVAIPGTPTTAAVPNPVVTVKDDGAFEDQLGIEADAEPRGRFLFPDGERHFPPDTGG